MLKKKRNIWNKRLIKEKIRELHSQGEDLSYGNIQITFRSLVWAGSTYFGSWGKAIESAGLDYSKIAKAIIRDQKTIIKEIKKLYRSGSKLNSNYMQQEHISLYSSACNQFGSWGKAIEAAGYDYSKIRVKPPPRRPIKSLIRNKRKILAEIRKRYRNKLPLNGETISKQDRTLYLSAAKEFGKKGWQKALIAAGIDPEKVSIKRKKFWDKEKIQKQIHYLADIGSPLYIAFLVRNGMNGLVQAGIIYFGSWKGAIESCGLDYSKIRRYCNKKWTPRLILDEIIILKEGGTRLSMNNVRESRNDLVASAIKYFGSWGQAVEAAGISYRQESLSWSYKAWINTLSTQQLKNIDERALELIKKGEKS